MLGAAPITISRRRSRGGWLAWAGWFHSNNMHVVERYTRTGKTLTWQATVEDPDVLIEPWTMDARTIQLNPNPKATLTRTFRATSTKASTWSRKSAGSA
jgi:hypothetical protein